jgi:hypothetical protein
MAKPIVAATTYYLPNGNGARLFSKAKLFAMGVCEDASKKLRFTF